MAYQTGLKVPPSRAQRPVNLALQGGGSHGAFTWGVLDRLLEDNRFTIDAISATSAGAVNAAAMAHGVSLGGREGARRKLEELWTAVSRKGRIWQPLPANPFEALVPVGAWTPFLNPTAFWMQAVSNSLSPYDINPFGLNPLRDVLNEVVDFDHLRACQVATRLFIAATNVRSGKVKIFENADLSVDAILASACLPTVFKAVEIDGESYWDGGFMGNPAIFPLIYKGSSRDVIVVHVNPIRREDVPDTAAEIRDRINEITFNSSLMREMRAIAFVQKLIGEQQLDDTQYKSMLIHDIRDDASMTAFSADTKASTDWEFLVKLRDIGRAAAGRWLVENAEHVGKRTTTKMAELYL
jgi:NTE family protein